MEETRAIEQRVAKRAKKERIQSAILQTVATAGLLIWALAAPNTLKLLHYMPGTGRRKTNVERSLKRLIERGLLEEVGKGASRSVRLTKQGELLVAKIELGKARLTTSRKWDGRWRVVVFDVPEKRRAARDRLRSVLKMIGFAKVQSSVWIYPYECEDIVRLIKANFILGREVLYVVAEEVEGGERYFRRFGISNPNE
ncbi:CRISPR-associated endonuclease Cas2 [bacterium]|nr:CRISPR-associated endonuclease Cas2 [bacterium]